MDVDLDALEDSENERLFEQALLEIPAQPTALDFLVGLKRFQVLRSD